MGSDLAQCAEAGEEVAVACFLAVVDFLAVQVDLKAAVADGGEDDGGFLDTSVANLCCETRSFPEVPSGYAVLDFQPDSAFCHVCLLYGVDNVPPLIVGRKAGYVNGGLK